MTTQIFPDGMTRTVVPFDAHPGYVTGFANYFEKET